MADTVMNFSEDDARNVFAQTLKGYGFTDSQINEMLPQIVEWQTVYTPGQIVNDLLPTTAAYQQRFAANAERVRAGLKPLSPSEYLSAEQSYRSVLRDAGMPAGFYDSTDDFRKFIASDVSAYEMKSRVDAASQAVNNADPEYKKALMELYGVDEATMAAHMLDPDRALPLIQRQAKAVEYGAAAARQGLRFSAPSLEKFAGMAGTTGYSAQQGFAAIAEMAPALQGLAEISGEQYNQETAGEEVFGGSAAARRKREQLTSQERQRFSGGSGVSLGSLGGGTTGMF